MIAKDNSALPNSEASSDKAFDWHRLSERFVAGGVREA